MVIYTVGCRPDGQKIKKIKKLDSEPLNAYYLGRDRKWKELQRTQGRNLSTQSKKEKKEMVL